METTMNPCAAKAQTPKGTLENGLASGLENARRLASTPAALMLAALSTAACVFFSGAGLAAPAIAAGLLSLSLTSIAATAGNINAKNPLRP